MGQSRRQYSEQFKFKGALEATKGVQTVKAIASQHELHPTQVSSWKQQLLEDGPGVFSRNRERGRSAAEHEAALYEQIGRLKMELEWLKETSLAGDGIPPGEKRNRL